MRSSIDLPAPLAVTMGEPAGIGIEIALKAWTNRTERKLTPFYCIGCAQTFRNIAAKLEISAQVQTIEDPRETNTLFADRLPVLDLPLTRPPLPGTPQEEHVKTVTECIKRAVADALDGRADGLITNPIQKQTLWSAGFEHPGHTEFIGTLCAAETKPIMMLMIAELKVVPVTVHIAMGDVMERLSSDAIIEASRTTAHALQTDFGIDRPRLAVAALNPHAGEGGQLGEEEITIIRPALEKLRESGVDISGPHPADTLFHAAARSRYDAAICMYHDQALIPLKTLDFERGVNITLGLPIVRTSPDHGTALDIAGQGVASPESLIAALNTARAIADQRTARG